jgi:lipid A disaccharide synthetase
VNLLAARTVAPELLQGYVTPDNLYHAVQPLLDPVADAAPKQREAFGAIRGMLGEPGVSARVAEMASRLVA